MVDSENRTLSLRYYSMLDKWGLYETCDIIFTILPIFDKNGQVKSEKQIIDELK